MKIYILTVRYILTRETEVKGVFSSEEKANELFREYQSGRELNNEKLKFENWHLAEVEFDMPIVG